MNCPSCGAPMRLTENDDSLRCEYCHAVYTPKSNEDGVRLLGEVSSLRCPVCSVALEQAAISGYRILYCTHCLGMLVPMADFLDLIKVLHTRRSESIQPPANRRDLLRHIDCPHCHRPMDTHIYEGPGNIVIDDCSRCFVNWLDRGELTKVVRAPDHDYT